MNVKKMTCDELRDVVENFHKGSFCGYLNNAEREFVEACRKELMRRWGIKG